MEARPRYKRILLKLSGEALQGGQGYGIDAEVLRTPDLPVSIKGTGAGMYQVSDEPYDQSMWKDSDQEGVGGYSGHDR